MLGVDYATTNAWGFCTSLTQLRVSEMIFPPQYQEVANDAGGYTGSGIYKQLPSRVSSLPSHISALRNEAVPYLVLG